MTKVLQTFRGFSGSQPVYYTNEQVAPIGLTGVALVSSLRIDGDESTGVDGAVEFWTLNGETGLTGSVSSVLLSVGTGTKIFGPGPISQEQSLFLNGSTRFQSPVTGSVQIADDVTVSCFIYPLTSIGAVTADIVAASGGSSSELEADNFLYDLRQTQGNRFESFFEVGAGANVFITPSPGSVAVAGRWSHIVYRRTSGTSSLYNNGRQVHTQDTGDPSGGSNAQVHIGGFQNNSSFFAGYVSRIKIFDRGLSDEEILQEKTAVLGAEI